MRDCSIHGNLAFKSVFQEEKMIKKKKKLGKTWRERLTGLTRQTAAQL